MSAAQPRPTPGRAVLRGMLQCHHRRPAPGARRLASINARLLHLASINARLLHVRHPLRGGRQKRRSATLKILRFARCACSGRLIWLQREDTCRTRPAERDRRSPATSWPPPPTRRRGLDPSPDRVSRRCIDEGLDEAIYQALYIQGRGALRRELTACLRTGRALRVPRARRRGRGKEFVGPDIMISERPAEAEDRAVPGHWEGDLIIGLGSSAIGTLVERTTRFTMLLHLPRMAEPGRLRVKNGPALTGHGADAVRDAITSTITTLPDQLRRSLTWDQGAEMAQHAQLRIDTGLQVFFCDPRSPWQRGTNENTNGLLRQYFPKGTDLNRHSASDIAAVAVTLNRRPRKTLGWRTPSEAFNELLLSHQ